jgi:hypothetical protein
MPEPDVFGPVPLNDVLSPFFEREKVVGIIIVQELDRREVLVERVRR